MHDPVIASNWLLPADVETPSRPTEPVIIVGAGWGGFSIALELARRGIRSQTLDEMSEKVRPSTNPAALLKPPLQMTDLASGELQFIGYQKLMATLSSEFSDGVGVWFEWVSAKHFPKDGEAFDPALQNIWKPQPDGSLLCGSLGSACVLVNLPEFCAAIRKKYSSFIEVKYGAKVTALRKNETGYELLGPGETVLANASNIVFATGFSETHIPELSPFPIKPLRGQMISWRADRAPLKDLQEVQHRKRFMTPLFLGRQYLGSTFVPNDSQCDIRKDEVSQLLSEGSCFGALSDPDETWAAVRAASRDTFPIYGKIPDFSFFPKHGMERRYLPGLWISNGFGSKGLIYGYLGADFIANALAGTAFSGEKRLWEHVLATRFWVRALRKPLRRPSL